MTAVASDGRSAPDSRKRLPDGWRWVRLGEVCRTESGEFLPRSLISPQGPVPVYGANGIIGFTHQANFSEQRIVVGRVGSCGAVNLTSGKAWITDNTLVCETLPPLDFFFLSHFLRSVDFISLRSASIQPLLTQKTLKGLILPLPPLPEQRRIAAILNEQMAAVARARAAAEARLEAAKALLVAYLEATFDSQGIRRWPSESLGNVLQLRKEIVHPRDNPEGPATFVGLEHVESITGRRIGSIHLEKAALTGRKPQFYTGDIVYGYLRPYLNKVWIAEFDGLCSVDQYVYSVDRKKANTEFVAWFMRSPGYLRSAPIDTTPGQLPRIRTEEVSSVQIHLPPLGEQGRIMETLKAQLDVAEGVRKAVADELAAINALPAVLLGRAFSGAL